MMSSMDLDSPPIDSPSSFTAQSLRVGPSHVPPLTQTRLEGPKLITTLASRHGKTIESSIATRGGVATRANMLAT